MIQSTPIATPGTREAVMTRILNAPPAVVFRTYTDPALIPQWWGPKRLTTTVDQMDVRPGGVWRFVQRDADGTEYAFNGVYKEIVPSERLVSTFEFEDLPGHIVLETVTFEALGDKTKLTTRSLFQSPQDRDGMIESGMEEGAAETLNRLGDLLAQNAS